MVQVSTIYGTKWDENANPCNTTYKEDFRDAKQAKDRKKDPQVTILCVSVPLCCFNVNIRVIVNVVSLWRNIFSDQLLLMIRLMNAFCLLLKQPGVAPGTLCRIFQKQSFNLNWADTLKWPVKREPQIKMDENAYDSGCNKHKSHD